MAVEALPCGANRCFAPASGTGAELLSLRRTPVAPPCTSSKLHTTGRGRGRVCNGHGGAKTPGVGRGGGEVERERRGESQIIELRELDSRSG